MTARLCCSNSMMHNDAKETGQIQKAGFREDSLVVERNMQCNAWIHDEVDWHEACSAGASVQTLTLTPYVVPFFTLVQRSRRSTGDKLPRP